MEKLVSFPQRVEDLSGLYLALRKASFAVRNVGADEKGTYVYLEEDEEKDPASFVESWAGRPAPPATAETVERLRKEFAEPPPGRERRPSVVARLFRRIF